MQLYTLDDELIGAHNYINTGPSTWIKAHRPEVDVTLHKLNFSAGVWLPFA
jgi:hypothetical protein